MTLTFRQLQTINLSDLSDKYLCQLATLIYNTDGFIFPAAFGNIKNARVIVSELIKQNDSMFSISNAFVAELNNEDIVGLLLWHEGPLYSSVKKVRTTANKLKITLPESLETVYNKYFLTYEETPKNTIAIMNVSVLPEYRGKGVGKKMLKAFCDSHNKEMELCVLKQNIVAIRLYESIGFRIVSERDGFSLEGDKPRCFDMKRCI